MRYAGTLPTIPARGWFATGDTGTEVVKMQKAINWANQGTIKAALKEDGEVGPLTIAAVSFFQEVRGLTIDGEFGPVCLNAIRNLDLTGAGKAVNWAWSIAKDNRFTYGAGKRAHRSGCYFCQTNTGPRKKKKEQKGEPHYVKDSKGNKHTYERTYCCNTLITAAYAHGAQDAKTLSVCRSGGCFGMTPGEWEKSPHFKRVGKCSAVPYSKLQPGDVIMSNKPQNGWKHHVWMYVGHGKYVEASGGNWSASSIAVKNGAKSKFNGYAKHKGCYVVRYKD